MLLTALCYTFYTALTLWLLAGVWAASAPTQQYTPLTRRELQHAARTYLPTYKIGNKSNAAILHALLAEGYV
jgi:hypothetical protein